jgi:glycerate dehydrogenase
LDGYTENPGDLVLGRFKALGDLTVYERTAGRNKRSAGSGRRNVITNKTVISKQILDAAPPYNISGFSRQGYNVVDVAAAKEKGIPVTNIPTYENRGGGAVYFCAACWRYATMYGPLRACKGGS